MDLTTCNRWIFGVVLTISALSILLPTEINAIPSPDMRLVQPSTDERATWLETRKLENSFKQLVYLALNELASEGAINPEIITNPGDVQVDKRGRHQGFCFRKTKTGRFLPYICWKASEHDKK